MVYFGEHSDVPLGSVAFPSVHTERPRFFLLGGAGVGLGDLQVGLLDHRGLGSRSVADEPPLSALHALRQEVPWKHAPNLIFMTRCKEGTVLWRCPMLSLYGGVIGTHFDMCLP